MFRYAACLAAALFAGTSLWAGELDREFGTKAPTTPTAVKTEAPALPVGDRRASELDDETPSQAHRRGYRGGWSGGWGRGWGYGWNGGWSGYRGGWYGGSRSSFGIGWGGYGSHRYGYYAPAVSYYNYSGYSYPGYSYYGYRYPSYSYYGYPTWADCW